MTTRAPQQNTLTRVIHVVNDFQKHHQVFGFIYGVVKKYGDDQAGYQGALITYYGFLSLFPLLIVATSITDLVSQHNAGLRTRLLSSINHYFPIVGTQLQSNVHGSTKTGVALIIGLLITIYGAKGVADVLQYALNHIWQVPRSKRPSFPKAPLISLAILGIGGMGVLIAMILSGFATAFGHSIVATILSTVLSALVLFGIFIFVMSIGATTHHSYRANIPGAAIAAVGLQILETLGGYLITHQLHNLQGAYGQFALVLAILFWLYLQAEVFLYAVECNTVLALGLWPRSLVSSALTDADKQAQKLYVGREQFYDEPAEHIDVRLKH